MLVVYKTDVKAQRVKLIGLFSNDNIYFVFKTTTNK